MKVSFPQIGFLRRHGLTAASILFALAFFSAISLALSGQWARAASCGSDTTFLCIGGGAAPWDIMTLGTKDDQTGAVGIDAPYRPVGDPAGALVRPGDTITVSISYNVNDNYNNKNNGPAILYADIGGDGAGFDPNLFQPGSISDQTTGESGYTFRASTSNSGAGYPHDLGSDITAAGCPYGGNKCPAAYRFGPPSTYNSDFCPSFYYDYTDTLSQFKDGSVNHYGGSGSGEPVQVEGVPFPTDGSADLIDSNWRNTCGARGGKSASWTNVSTSSPGGSRDIHTYTMRFQINPAATSTSKFCIRGILAFHNVVDQYARTSSYGCFQMQATSVYGYIKSNPAVATGQGLNGAQVTIYSNCNDLSNPQVATTKNDAGGNPGWYAGTAIVGAPACINPQNPFTDVATNTTYNNPQPAPGFPSNICTTTPSCGPFNFYYDPIPVIPTPSKVVTNPAAAGAAVTPGQAMTFSMTLANPIDSNTAAAGSPPGPAPQLVDEIPLNIDPGSINSINANFSTSGPAPGGWTVSAVLTCNGLDSGFNFGYASPNNNSSGYRCGYSAPAGSTPGYVYVTFNNMPAYGSVTLSWSGRVYDAAHVGIYPTNGSYCNPPNPVDYSNFNSIFAGPLSTAGCQDPTNGLQGVSNFAYAYFNPTVNYSNPTYNPIPGKITCLGKDTDAATMPAFNPPTVAGTCGAQQPAPGSKWIYSPNTLTYGSAKFTIYAQPDATGGPVYYTVKDKDTNTPLDPAMQSTSAYSGGSQNNGAALGAAGSQWLQWANEDSVITSGYPGSELYSFNVTFQDQGLGHDAKNYATACWPQYWLVGHQSTCVTSNPIDVYQTTITNPFVVASNGDVHAGGGIGATCGTTSDQTNPYTRQNQGANGQYFVTATGNFRGAADKNSFFVSQSGTTSGTGANTYGVICRPDIVTSTTNYANKVGNQVFLPAGTPIAADQKSWTIPGYPVPIDVTGKVVHVLGNYTINAPVAINTRWTLQVDGDLNITGNGSLTVKNATLNGQPETQPASFGVVVNGGNMYIDKGISELDGFYFVAPDTNGNQGRINTCASPGGFTTLGSGYQVPECSGLLTVKGLMMANIFRLNRTTDPGAGLTNPAEYVQFDDRLYTATPPGFSTLGQTYLPPIYLPQTKSRY